MPAAPSRLTVRRGDLALVLAALCFGSTFLAVKDAVVLVEPVPFLALRFLIAAAVLGPLARRRRPSANVTRDGVAAGLLLVVGYALQTVGLQYTGSATSAFITYLLVVFVPVIGLVVPGHRPHPVTVAGIAVAVAGLALLTGGAGRGGAFGRGELLTVGCAVAFAAHVVLLGRTAHRHDPVRFTWIQVTTVAAACLVPGLWLGGYRFPGSALVAAAATGAVATALAFLLMVAGQRTVPPARAAVLLLVEPVFAAVLATVRGEHLGGIQLLGGALILAAVGISDALPEWLDRRVNSREAGPDNDRSQRAAGRLTQPSDRGVVGG